MKRNIGKRVLVGTLIGGMLLSGSLAYANPKPMLISTNPKVERQEKELTPRGTIMLNKDIYKKNGETIMLPLRQVIEGIELEISWNKEQRAAEVKYINKTLTVKANGEYLLNGKVVKADEKATIVEDRLYVSANVLKETLNIESMQYGDDVMVKKEEVAKEFTGYGEILEITEGSKGTKLITFMNSYNMNEYRLVVGKDTVIVDPINNKEIKVDDLKVYDTIYAEYSGAMTRSIPPQTGAKRIEVVKDTAVSYGLVEKVDGDKVIINIGTRGGVHLNLLEGCKIQDSEGKTLTLEDIKPGDRIRIYHAQIMLMVEPLTYPTVMIIK